MLRISELRNKDVINIKDGKRLGNIDDIDMDVNSGRIEALVIPEPGRLLSLRARPEETIVSWQQIRRIGLDVILIDPEQNAVQPRSDYSATGPEEDVFATDIYRAEGDIFDL